MNTWSEKFGRTWITRLQTSRLQNVFLLPLLLLALLMGSCRSPEAEPLPTLLPESAVEGVPEGASADETLIHFYEQYSLYPGNPLATEAYRVNDSLTRFLHPDWIAEVDSILASFESQGGGFDPFVCAQDLPSEFEVEEQSCSERECSLQVQADFPGSSSYLFTVMMVREAENWQVREVRCSPPEVEPAARAGASESLPEPPPDANGEWRLYHSERWGFSLDLPPGWQALEDEVYDRSPNDPVSGYVNLVADGLPTAVSLVVSEAPLESFRAVFPEPDGGSSWPGFEDVLVEEHFDGELYLIYTHPQNPEFRVCFRVLDPVETLNREMEEFLMEMLRSFSFNGGQTDGS